MAADDPTRYLNGDVSTSSLRMSSRHRLDEARNADQGIPLAVTAKLTDHRGERGRVVGRLAALHELGRPPGGAVLEQTWAVRCRPHVHHAVDLAGVEKLREKPARQAP